MPSCVFLEKPVVRYMPSECRLTTACPATRGQAESPERLRIFLKTTSQWTSGRSAEWLPEPPVAALYSMQEWPLDWFRRLIHGHMPPPVTGLDRSSAVDVHQLRAPAGHCSQAQFCKHRIDQPPNLRLPGLQQRGLSCTLCSVCREEPDLPTVWPLRWQPFSNIASPSTSTPPPKTRLKQRKARELI